MIDFTEFAVRDFLGRVDAYCENEKNDVSEIYIGFREFERQVLKELQWRFYKKYPYNYNAKMTHSTDVSPRKIRTICNKK